MEIRLLGLCAALVCGGCGTEPVQPNAAAEPSTAKAETAADSQGTGTADARPQQVPNDTGSSQEEIFGLPEAIELDPQRLLAAALPADQLEQGWVRLFDGQSPFGWFVVGQANWSIENDTIGVSQGEPSFFCTSFQLADFELKVDFRSDPGTNSGVFLRTGIRPEDVAKGCLELNIAPPDNPFPTGSFVQRKKLEPAELDEKAGGKFDPSAWHTYHVRLIGNHVEVFLDDKPILELDDFPSNPTGHISLQHNQGRVEFRNLLLKPVGMRSLKVDAEWEQDWTKSVKEGVVMAVEPVEGGLKLKGGLGQLQSKEDFGDFFLQASYTLAASEVNSGIFFRCIRDNLLDGYECQVNHATIDGDPLRPADAGAGAIFRRQSARIVMGDGTQKSYVTLLANGPQFLTWVNGIQVAEFSDSRAPDENPRRGLRTAPGPVSLQAHDETTEVIFHSVQVNGL